MYNYTKISYLHVKKTLTFCATNVSWRKLILTQLYSSSFKVAWSDSLVIIFIIHTILLALSSGTNFNISKQTMGIIFHSHAFA